MPSWMRWFAAFLVVLFLAWGLVVTLQGDWLGWVFIAGSLLTGAGLIVMNREERRKRPEGRSPVDADS
jgi:hypothetical protein